MAVFWHTSWKPPRGSYFWEGFLFLGVVLIFGSGSYFWEWFLFLGVVLIFGSGSYFLSGGSRKGPHPRPRVLRQQRPPQRRRGPRNRPESQVPPYSHVPSAWHTADSAEPGVYPVPQVGAHTPPYSSAQPVKSQLGCDGDPQVTAESKWRCAGAICCRDPRRSGALGHRAQGYSCCHSKARGGGGSLRERGGGGLAGTPLLPGSPCGPR